MAINKVCVIGSGVMGSGIAAQVANAKIKVLLLDLAKPEAADRSEIARNAKDRLKDHRPPPLSHHNNINLISVGNLEDDLEQIRDVDLVIEVIVEKLEVKHSLYKKIAPYLKSTALFASNTSTLPLKDLNAILPEDLKKRFFITHFFNPPRYLELLELISPANVDNLNEHLLKDFLTKKLGKTVIDCNDTPGFIANRVGCFFLELAVRLAIEEKLNPAYVDQLVSKIFGFPSTGIFGLYDLIGHDVMRLISESLVKSLDKEDNYHRIFKDNHLLDIMRGEGKIGRKSGAGFYKLEKIGDKKEMLVLNLADNEYHKIEKFDCPASVSELFSKNDEYSRYFHKLFEEFFLYVTSLIPSVTAKPEDIDAAMRLGYSLKYGPFELLSRMPGGASWLGQNNNSELEKFTKITFQKAESWLGYELVEDSGAAKILQNADRIIFVICSKMGTLNATIFDSILKTVDLAEQQGKKIYICSNNPVFSAGADLRFFKEKIENKEFIKISELIKLGQRAMRRIKTSKVPVIALAHGLALGGGAEILLHAHHVIAHQNINAGLVEVSVGLIPGWGGVKEMFIRGIRNQEDLRRNLSNIVLQKKSSSAECFAEEYGVNCHLNMNKNFLLEEAIGLQVDFNCVTETGNINLPKFNFVDELKELHKLDELQKYIVEQFQSVIDAAEVSVDELFDFEHAHFIELCHKPYALERINKFV